MPEIYCEHEPKETIEVNLSQYGLCFDTFEYSICGKCGYNCITEEQAMKIICFENFFGK